MNLKKLAVTALSTSLLLSAAHQAHAAGFYIQEQSVKGLGSAFSGSTTSIEDASTVYFNPAGMTKLDRMQLNAGVHLLLPDADLTNNGTVNPVGGATIPTKNPYSASPIPNLYAVVPINSQFWAGIGVSAPFGLGSDYSDNWFGRYDSTKTELKTINIAPSFAYKANDWLSLGGGIDIQYADANLESAVFVGAGTQGTSQLKGDDWSLGYNIGIQAKPLPNTEVGVHYRSAISHTLDGKVNISGTGTPADSSRDGTADLDLPDIFTFGVAQDITPKTRLMGQATWFGWNNFQDIDAETTVGINPPAVVQNYQTTWAFSVGAEHDLNDKVTVRAGYQYDETPTTNQFRTSRTPDGDRNWFSGGATYKLNDAIDLDFAATYIDVDSGTINVPRNGGQVRAKTDGNVKILAIGLNYKF